MRYYSHTVIQTWMQIIMVIVIVSLVVAMFRASQTAVQRKVSYAMHCQRIVMVQVSVGLDHH